MFPLNLLPLPGELVPLHIFEPRYRQLLQDAESDDIRFGIHFNHEINTEKLGSLMRLESVIKRYPSGESDIIVRCEDIITLQKLYRTHHNKTYPGGDVTFLHVDQQHVPGPALYELFLEYLTLRNIKEHLTLFTVYTMANEMNLNVNDRYLLLTTHDDKKETFLINRLRYHIHILKQEGRSKDVFHLN